MQGGDGLTLAWRRGRWVGEFRLTHALRISRFGLSLDMRLGRWWRAGFTLAMSLGRWGGVGLTLALRLGLNLPLRLVRGGGALHTLAPRLKRRGGARAQRSLLRIALAE